MVNAITVAELHITDAVTAVNFDIRGFDTLGEEFILFTSVAGVLLLMRRREDEPAGDHEDKIDERNVPPASDAVRVTALSADCPHGTLRHLHRHAWPGLPRRRFPGRRHPLDGPAATLPLRRLQPVSPGHSERLIEIAGALGAAAYILIGLACVVSGGLFLQNFLPLGKSGSLTAGGMVPLIDIAVGLEVSGGVTLVILAYLEELVEEKEQ